MKKISKILFVFICLLVICQGSVFSKGLYQKESTTTQKIENNDSKMLKAPTEDPDAPDGPPAEPGEVAPISDGLWVLGALSAIYAFQIIRKDRLKVAQNHRK